jgi:hypothetical protein
MLLLFLAQVMGRATAQRCGPGNCARDETTTNKSTFDPEDFLQKQQKQESPRAFPPLTATKTAEERSRIRLQPLSKRPREESLISSPPQQKILAPELVNKSESIFVQIVSGVSVYLHISH